MIRFLLLATLISTALSLRAQITPTIVTTLDGTVSETSGLTHINGRILTHNDSGDGPNIYEIDTADGSVIRTVHIANAGASDWEDITHDSTHIYLADFGNNAGNRQNLRIYRVLISDFLAQDTILADTISFHYADQTDFSPQTYQTNFDAEALVAWGDSLYIFTKNWGNFRTNIYPLSKVPGTYTAIKRDSIDSQGLVTGAEYDPISNSIWLVGYFLNVQFLVEIPAVSGLPFSGPTTTRMGFTASPAIQVEAICPLDGITWLVSAEAGQGASDAHLYRFSKPAVSTDDAAEASSPIAYPSPGRNKVRVEVPGKRIEKIRWFTSGGCIHTITDGTKADTSGWPAGTYFAEPIGETGEVLGRVKVIIQ